MQWHLLLPALLGMVPAISVLAAPVGPAGPCPDVSFPFPFYSQILIDLSGQGRCDPQRRYGPLRVLLLRYMQRGCGDLGGRIGCGRYMHAYTHTHSSEIRIRESEIQRDGAPTRVAHPTRPALVCNTGTTRKSPAITLR
ncbi:hypothetical protein B0I35DRAFT_430799 [Stachybotrys elegans]|uniref:Uncharacterized protein n=1 Tax=Stachybotrys elegans TaxID=80388 RepID=A0A8K0WTC5_9HYPO|nr:hypothetical protein B0I35DRAFT_430799 [Stachybotrys elegans]